MQASLRQEMKPPARWTIAATGARRSLLLCAAGAVGGLAIAGFGLFTAQGTRTSSVPAEDAAIVNGVPVLRADLIQQVGALYGVDFAQATPQQKARVLADMIREELYVQRGIEMGLATDDTDVRAALVQGTEALVAQDAMATLPPEEDLRQWYRAHTGTYATEGVMTLHDWIVPGSMDGAAGRVAALRAGGDPARLGLRSSGKVDDGAEFYFAARLHLGDALFAVARRMANGEVSDPLSSPDGVHILQMVENVRPVATPYPQVRGRVLQDFLADKVKRLQSGNERFLHDRADIKLAADLR